MITLDERSDVPKYRQLSDQFRERIRSGALRPGDQLPPLNEMRDTHGISRPTVEKAYSLLEQDGLIERLHGAGVFVKHVRRTRTAARRKSGIIGLSGAGFGVSGYSTYWSTLLGGAREAASQADMQLLLLDPAKSQGWEKVDGVLVCDWNDSRVPRRELPGLPLVSLMTPIEGIASVCADDAGGIRLSMEHLLGQGHRRIAYLHTSGEFGVTQSRIDAYRQSLADAGIQVDERWLLMLGGNYYYGADFTREAHIDVGRWLRGNWAELGCTALLCHNDETAVGAIRAFAEAGMRVPHDVSVMGFDGTEFCNVVSPPLSSIGVPLREIGQTAVELLLSQIDSGTANDTHRVLKTTLQPRESTAALKVTAS